MESNFETSDREGEIKIVFEDGSKVCHTIHQTTSALEDVNGEIITNTRNLSLTSGVGYTTNVFRHSESYKYHVSVCTPINFARLVTVLDSVGEADALFKEDQAGSKYESITGSTFTHCQSAFCQCRLRGRNHRFMIRCVVLERWWKCGRASLCHFGN